MMPAWEYVLVSDRIRYRPIGPTYETVWLDERTVRVRRIEEDGTISYERFEHLPAEEISLD